ncbi:MAG: hypothetical protein NTX59_02520 [Elusimicrobia bacterium]|nr:hypothetical protein [Elusimicrobiota bacterium]
MAVIAVFMLIWLGFAALCDRGNADVRRIVAEDRIATLLKLIEYLEAHEQPAKLAVLPEYLAMKKVIAEAEQNAGKYFPRE